MVTTVRQMPVMRGDDPLRGTGRTTGLMLVAIGTALQRQGEWIGFVDHSDCTVAIAETHRAALASRCEALGLIMDVERKGSKVRIRSSCFS